MEQAGHEMRAYLDQAATRFGLTLTGPLVEGQYLRSLSGPATGPDGPVWLRVGREHTKWIDNPDTGDFWTGVPDTRDISAVLTGLPLPAVLASTELGDDPDGLR